MIESLMVFDISAMLMLLVVSSLSRQLGEALKIPPYYRIFYIAAGLVFLAACADSLREQLQHPLLPIVSIGARAFAALVSLVVCLPYWKWLFSEYFYKQR